MAFLINLLGATLYIGLILGTYTLLENGRAKFHLKENNSTRIVSSRSYLNYFDADLLSEITTAI